ncbi:MAG: hypothetical protein E6501_34430, partial [Bradyrhizobium sp.]|nr:hypothetical protein [Bradyrhizobium sp.]
MYAWHFPGDGRCLNDAAHLKMPPNRCHADELRASNLSQFDCCVQGTDFPERAYAHGLPGG